MSFWESKIIPPEKKQFEHYSYITRKENKEIILLNKEKLDEVAEKDVESILFVTSPQDEKYALFGTKPEQFEQLIKWKWKSLKNNVRFPLIIILMGIVLIIGMKYNGNKALTSTDIFLPKFLFVIYGILPLVSAILEYFSLKSIKNSSYETEYENIRFEYWLRSESSKLQYVLPVFLAIIFIFQLFLGVSDMAIKFGLVKEATRQGEYWRMLTAIFFHGNFMHIVFNGVALIGFGALLLKFKSYSHYFMVFLISGLVGSCFSIVFYPDATSVGASGGIMGLMGFLIVLGFKLRKIVPRKFIKSLIENVLYVALLGIIAYDYIDNGAHAGGLLTGMALGLLEKEEKIMNRIDGMVIRAEQPLMAESDIA